MLSSFNRQSRAYCFAIASVLLWSTVASAFKISLRYVDTFQLLWLSTIFATLSLLVILFIQKKQLLVFRLNRHDYIRLLLLGLLSPFLYYLILFKAYELLPAQVAQSLNYTWAITLMILSIPILKHKVTRYDIVATLFCYSGVVIICMGGVQVTSSSLSLIGIGLALGSTVIWALYWLYKTKDNVEPVAGLFLSFLFSLPFITIACYLYSDFRVGNLYGVLGGMYVGLVEMGITFVLWLTALQLTSSIAKISTLIYCSPLLSLFFIQFFVGEVIATTTVTGLIMIISGLALQQKEEKS